MLFKAKVIMKEEKKTHPRRRRSTPLSVMYIRGYVQVQPGSGGEQANHHSHKKEEEGMLATSQGGTKELGDECFQVEGVFSSSEESDSASDSSDA